MGVGLLRNVYARALLRVPELEVERVCAGLVPGVEVGVVREGSSPRPYGTEGTTRALYRVIVRDACWLALRPHR